MVSVAALAGCYKDKGAGSAANRDEMLRAHWAGRTNFLSNTNTAYQAALWRMPEGQKFEEYMLDRLAFAMIRVGGQTNYSPASTNSARHWRELLKAAIDNESFLQLSTTKAGGLEGGLAIRTSREGASEWKKALSEALSTGGVGASTAQGGWNINTSSGVARLTFHEQNGWTALAFNSGGSNSVFLKELTKLGPMNSKGTNSWFQAVADVSLLERAIGFSLEPVGLRRTDLSMHSDGEFVRTTARLAFDHKLKMPLEPWSIPTNIIRNPMLNFTAVRGIRPWMEEWLAQTGVKTGAPNQLFLWSLQGGAIFSYAAMPVPQATKLVDELSVGLRQQFGSWITNNARGSLVYDAKGHEFAWVSLPVFTPGFSAVTSNVGNVLLGKVGMMTPPPTTLPFPPQLLDVLQNKKQLAYYQWEITENRLSDLFLITQAGRLAFRKAQMPANSPSVNFLKAAAPKLGNSVTTVTHSEPAELLLERKSHSGLTALEWHLAADWVESPQFPRGLHTLLGTTPGMLRWNEQKRAFVPENNGAK